MKALTLTQPYASLVAIGAKKIETRSWKTSYRGPLAIHAAKGFPKEARRFTLEPVVYETYRLRNAAALWPNHPSYPLGVVLATCRLVDCKFITSAMSPEAWPGEMALRSTILPPEEPERSFGNYECGRYAWLIEDIVPLKEPIPARGALSLWEWEQPA